jgi:apolipoprotein N-acyltransferase
MNKVTFAQRILQLPNSLALLLAFLAGALITLSFAPFKLWPLALPAIAIFALLIREQRLKQVLLRSWAFGTGLFAAGVHWIFVSIHNFGSASPLLAGFLVFIFACFMGLLFAVPFYIFGRWFSRHALALIVALPACWLLGEWMRTWFLTGFPWLFIGYGHVDTWLAGWAPVIGVIGTGFIVVLTACLGAEWLWQIKQSLKPRALIITSIFTLGLWAAGPGLNTVTWAQPSAEAINVGIVQPNLDQSIKLSWSQYSVTGALDQLRDMSEELWGNDWVIWPEAAIPTELTYHTALPFLEEMNTKAAQTHTALFTGVIFDERPSTINGLQKTNYYNSIVGLGEGLGFYHKRKMVPFGEYVPFEAYLRNMIEFFNLPTSFISIGPSDQHGLIAKGLRITPVVCYEIAFPDLIAQSAKETQVLLSVNNLGWFLDSIQSKQFLQMTQMRALETGRYLIYSTNNGPSAFIDNHGQIINHSHSFTSETLSGKVYPVKDWTPFMILGSWPLALVAALMLMALKGWSLRANKKIRQAQDLG